MKIDIHDNQKKAAKEIVNHYNSVKVDNYPPVLLVAQPQSGKTGAVIYALEKIIENNKLKDPDSWTTVFWIGPSDVNLKQQTLERIESTSQTVKRNLLDATVYHMPDLLSSNNSNELLIKRYNEAKERKDYILVVMDEAHIGIGFDQTLPEFFKQRLGFFPGFEDSKEKVFTIIVTATPGSFLNYAGSKKKTSNGDSFRYVYLEPGKDYNSFKLMKQKGRIGDAYLVNDEASWYKFFHDQFIPFITGENGYFIFRMSKKYDFISKKLNEYSSKFSFNIKTYHSDYKNIAQLDEDLKQMPNNHTFCLIVGSYLQGKTFNDMKYVRGWWERVNKATTHTFIAQSAGRNCGYNNRNTYDYPIALHIEQFDDIIKFYDLASKGEWSKLEEDFLLNSTHLRKVNSANRTSTKIIWDLPKMFNTLKQAKEFLQQNSVDYRVATISGHSYKDLAAELNNNMINPHLGRSNGNKEKDAVVVYIDKPSSKYRKSYKELVKKMNGLSAIVFLRKKTNQQNLIVKSKDVYSKPFSYRKTTKI